MNNIELQALRHLLFFSVPEAALLVAASPDRPIGVQERTWRRWEDGTLTVPDNIAKIILKLAEWRETAIDSVVESICAAEEQFGEDHDTHFIWYDTLDDWLTLEGRDALLWRPNCSVCADAAAMGVRLIAFNSADYSTWLGNRKDSEKMRAAWGMQKSA